MQVGKIGHASIVVRGGGLTCFMDPVFTDPFESGANTFDPPIEIDVQAIQDDCDVIILSHAHMDHFSPATLALFDRSIPVLFPEGEAAIERALTALGFERPTAIGPGSRVELAELRITPTLSKVGFPEMGMVFEADGRVFWNLVDTVVDERIIDGVLGIVGRPDLLFAKFQPLIESPLQVNALGSEFPFELYGQLLKNVWAIGPRYVAPGSCGYRYVQAAWLNDRGFPITELQFEADLRQVAPELHVLHIPHGGAVEIADEVRPVEDDFRYAKRRIDALMSSFDWRPERGVPALVDTNPLGHPVTTLQAQVDAYLDGDFLTLLRATDGPWLQRMRRLGVVWRLEVVYPTIAPQTRLLDFTAPELGWSRSTASTFVKMHTSVTSSAVVGLLRGELNSYVLNFNNIRLMNRLYGVHADGVVKAGDAGDDPLGKILVEGADDRYIDREVQLALERSRRESP